MDFIAYCYSKKIDVSQFQSSEPARFAEWEYIFNQAGATSFTQQKLFLINDVRRRYKYVAPIVESKTEMDIKPAGSQTTAPKPAGFKPKFK